MSYNRTVDLKCSSTISICTTGYEKSQFTVMLTCTVDGGKIPHFIIFKKKVIKINTILNSIHIIQYNIK